jgi:hypothetical protein
MKANYVERPAPELLGGKIPGLEPQARNVAVRVRDSISARFNSLGFHHSLMGNVRESERRGLASARSSDSRTQTILAASWHTHFLFDDLVFNAASLCDYLGNAVWFGFHGGNYIRKKWNSAYDAARREDVESKLPRGPMIHRSRTGLLVLKAHENFVNDLYGYRSDLIHHSIDGPDVYSHEFWERRGGTEERLAMPRLFSKRLRRLIPVADAESQTDIFEGGRLLVVQLGQLTVEILTTLREELGWTDGEPLQMLM